MREGETSQEGGAMIPELERIFEHSEAQRWCLVRLVDMVQEGRRDVELSDLLRNLRLESNCLPASWRSSRVNWRKQQGQGEMTNQTWKVPTLSLKNPISIPHFAPSFFYYVQDNSTVTLCLI
ncbi:hypothetical protein AMTR_s00020p00051620 [Amborella trichopoda]|uniref:Uncharacterized protein n=1 Tax=Amborella trichopoda TaxID=13333 RepID=W1PP93_AMBTC|nr:hypothetical protein AMTR_s00020p00051620 [Amborella trichopoda]